MTENLIKNLVLASSVFGQVLIPQMLLNPANFPPAYTQAYVNSSWTQSALANQTIPNIPVNTAQVPSPDWTNTPHDNTIDYQRCLKSNQYAFKPKDFKVLSKLRVQTDGPSS